MRIGKFEIPELAVRYDESFRAFDRLGQARELRRDINTGLLFAVERDTVGTVTDAWFMTECCTAAQTYPGDGGGLCCKKCWYEVDPALDQLIDRSKVEAVK